MKPLDDKKKNSKLAGMDMPAPASPEEDTQGAYTDPDTGKSSDKEPGLEEGDLVLDYALPLRNLFTGGIAAAGKMVLNAAAKKAGTTFQSKLQEMRDNVPPSAGATARAPEGPSLDYSQMGKAEGPGESGMTIQYRQGGYNGQQGAGNTTAATRGMDLPANPRPALRLLKNQEEEK